MIRDWLAGAILLYVLAMLYLISFVWGIDDR